MCKISYVQNKIEKHKKLKYVRCYVLDANRKGDYIMITGGENDILVRFKNEEGPIFFSIDVTGKCNFRCLHCYNDSGNQLDGELTDEEVLDVVRQAAELKPVSLCLCGGEPMLRKNILELIKAGTKNGTTVNMVSNGYLCSRELLEKMKDAGLDTLQISLDGINEMQHDTFRGFFGAFDKAIQTMKDGINVGLNVITSFTPNKMNVRTLDDYFALCNDIGISQVRIMPLIPMGRGSKIDNLLLNSDEYFLLQQKILKANIFYRDKKMTIEWGDPLDHYLRMTYNAKAGIRTANFEVKANGNLTVSTYIPIVVGNCREHSLREYWDIGYKSVWKREEVIEYVSKIITIYDINQLEPKPYSGEIYYIDIWNNRLQEA